MSLRSMTGYGRGVARGQGMTATVEISTVNRKQCDISVSLPRGLQLLEARVTEAVAEVVRRGRVMVDISLEWSGTAQQQAVRVNMPLATAYVRSLRQAAQALKVVDDISIHRIASLPDVLQFARPQEDAERSWGVLEKALAKALRDLDAMRRREGKALQQDLQQRLRLLGQSVAAIRRQAPGVAKRYRAQLLQRLDEAGVSRNELGDRLMKEIAFFADRSDISEELTRLDSHLAQAREMTRSKEATGRSLDFLAQEIFREINTIGSKANAVGIQQQAVLFKTELERIREQVQNIE
jgi:uncharacterized protein (TIGR00255 family)